MDDNISDSECLTESLTPTLAQPYHSESSTLVTDRLTPQCESPGHYEYDFGESSPSNHVFQSQDDPLSFGDSYDDDLYSSEAYDGPHVYDSDYMESDDQDMAELGPTNELTFNSTDLEGVVVTGDTTEEEARSDADKDGVFWVESEVDGESVLVRMKHCTNCEKDISLGEGDGLNAFHQHQSGSRCRNATSCKERALKEVKTQRRISDMFKKPPIPSNREFSNNSSFYPSSSISATVPTTSIIDVDADDTRQATTSSKQPSSSSQPSALSIITSALTDAGLCPGVQLDFPGSPFCKYPWQLHSFENLSYVIEHLGLSGELFARSKKCH